MVGLLGRARRLPGAGLVGAARRLPGADQGIAAIEFALVLPIMLTLLLGGFECSNAIAVWRKLSITTRAVTDLTTQNVSVSSSDLSTIMNAAAQIFAPYSTAKMGIVVSQISIDKNGNATVSWSQAQGVDPQGANTQALSTGSSVTLPSGIGQPGTNLIYSKITYGYQPTFTMVMPSSIPMADALFMNPRLSSSIAYKGS